LRHLSPAAGSFLVRRCVVSLHRCGHAGRIDAVGLASLAPQSRGGSRPYICHNPGFTLMKIMPAHWMAATARPMPASWLSRVFWLFGIVMAALHAWAAAQAYSMNADGIAYLDIGDAYMRGDWDVAVNPVWSPLYSWIIGT